MEANFYDDMHFTPRLGGGVLDGDDGYGGLSDSMTNGCIGGGGLKRPVTLNLDGGLGGNSTKKSRHSSNLLNSPDLNMLKLASPELERLIIQSNHGNMATPTPSAYYKSNATASEEQEQYARGFVDALAQMHQTTSQAGPVPCAGSNVARPVGAGRSGGESDTSSLHNPTTTSCTILQSHPYSSGNPGGYGNGVVSNGLHHPLSIITPDYPPLCLPPEYTQHSGLVKEEPQTVPCGLGPSPPPHHLYGASSSSSPPISPINMENQEKIKLERKRLRNRIAASKCRRKKLERIALLESKVNELKNINNGLSHHASTLREQVENLKLEIMDHINNGCPITLAHSSLT